MKRFLRFLIIIPEIFFLTRLNAQCSGALTVNVTGSGTGSGITTASAGRNQNSFMGNFTMASTRVASGETGTWTIVGTTSTTTPTIADIHSPTTTVNGIENLKSATLRWTIMNGTCTSTSDVVLSTDFALPIELMQFTVQKQKQSVVLNWVTASEKDNKLFIVERLTTGNFFSEIGEMKGAGNTFTEHKYQFIDETPVIGINYYRLRAVDFSGQTTFSNIISVEFFAKKEVIVFPNPVSDILNIKITTETEGKVSFEVINLSGQIFTPSSSSLKAGSNLLSLSVSDLPASTYFIRFGGGLDVAPIKFVKN